APTTSPVFTGTVDAAEVQFQAMMACDRNTLLSVTVNCFELIFRVASVFSCLVSVRRRGSMKHATGLQMRQWPTDSLALMFADMRGDLSLNRTSAHSPDSYIG